jgi:hypothetical protein
MSNLQLVTNPESLDLASRAEAIAKAGEP